MIEDRLRAVRLDEPRMDLDVDDLVARAGRRRALLGAVVATCAVAVAMMAIGLALGGREAPRPATVAAAPTPTTPTTPPSSPPTTTDDCFDKTPELVKVIATHMPKARLEPLSSCPVTVYRVVGTAEFLALGRGDAAVPAAGYELVDDLAGPGDGRLWVYQGPARGDVAVLLVGSDGTMVSVSTTGPATAVFDLDALIALVTDPALLR